MKQTCISVLVILFSIGVMAQDFQGVATYKTQRKFDVKLDSAQMGSDMHERMLIMLKTQFEKTYTLNFNKETSIYKEEEQLEAPEAQVMRMMVVTTGGSDVYYRNIKEGRYTSQSEVFGKVFLIKDRIQKLNWILGKETKKIGVYTCYKATMKQMVEVVESGISVNGDKNLNANTEETLEMKTIELVAWFTPQIPINSGPAKYHGLPGLILEVNDGQETIICSKIVLNPKNEVVIKEPVKGKEITQKKYEAVLEKKQQEEQDRYEHRREGDGHRVEVRIGG